MTGSTEREWVGGWPFCGGWGGWGGWMDGWIQGVI